MVRLYYILYFCLNYHIKGLNSHHAVWWTILRVWVELKKIFLSISIGISQLRAVIIINLRLFNLNRIINFGYNCWACFSFACPGSRWQMALVLLCNLIVVVSAEQGALAFSLILAAYLSNSRRQSRLQRSILLLGRLRYPRILHSNQLCLQNMLILVQFLERKCWCIGFRAKLTIT